MTLAEHVGRAVRSARGRSSGLGLALLVLCVALGSGTQVAAAGATVAPAKPVLGAHSVSNGSVAFAWTEPTTDGSVTDFQYSYKRADVSTWGAPVSTGGASSTVVTGLTNGQAYNVRVRAVSASSVSAWGAQWLATPRPYPSEPTGVTAQADGTGVLVQWGAPVNDDGEPVTGYLAQFRVSGGSYGPGVDVGAGDARSYRFTDWQPGKTYYLQLRAVNRFGGGSWSSPLKVVVPLPSAPAPQNLTATPGRGSMLLAWTAPDQADVSFEVRHRTSATGSSWVTDPSTSASSTEITGLQDGTSYLFNVRSVAGSAASSWVQVQKTPGVKPDTIGIPTVRLQDDRTTSRVSWSAVDDASLKGYDVNWYVPGVSGSKTVRVPAGTTSYDITDMPTNVVNRVKVRAVNSTGAGYYSPAQLAFVPSLSMPTLTVNTTGSAPIVDTETYVTGTYALDPRGSAVSAQAGTLSIKGHGNTTWGQPKKPYRLKLDSKAPLMGMPTNKNWILLANYRDKTMLRNAVALRLGQQTSLAWTPRSAFVEVILNGQYVGAYQLTEHVRLDPNRVNVTPMTPSDTSGSALTGGYLIERDQKYDPATESGFYSDRGLPFSLKDPDPPTPEQLDYIRSYVNQTETAILDKPLDDPVQGYRNFIDVGSFVDWYLVEEYVRNNDIWNSSAYMYKPRDGKLFMGPLWDFDLSQGTTVAAHPSPPTGWYARVQSPWFARLLSDPSFAAAYEQRWRDMRPAVAALPAYVDSVASGIATAEATDKARWGYSANFSTDVSSLKQWLTDRADWIDTQVPAAPAGPVR